MDLRRSWTRQQEFIAKATVASMGVSLAILAELTRGGTTMQAVLIKDNRLAKIPYVDLMRLTRTVMLEIAASQEVIPLVIYDAKPTGVVRKIGECASEEVLKMTGVDWGIGYCNLV